MDGQEIAGYTGFPETANQSEFHELVFPAGMYELTLVADAAPVTVTMKFSGLTGTTVLTPQTPAEAQTSSVSPSLLPTTEAPVELSAGAQAKIGSALGVLAVAISYRFSVRVGDMSNWCLYSGAQTVPAGEYLPGCPGDQKVLSLPGFIILQQGINVPSGLYGIVFVRGKQTWSQGVWAAGASVIASSNPANFLWLSS